VTIVEEKGGAGSGECDQAFSVFKWYMVFSSLERIKNRRLVILARRTLLLPLDRMIHNVEKNQSWNTADEDNPRHVIIYMR
jgi:hypothetical protein